MLNLVITITGPSGSGKSELESGLERLGYGKKVTSVTTRDLRKGEIEGVHYHKVSFEKFDEYLKNMDMIEHVSFGGNNYGVHKKDLHPLSLIVCETNGKKQIEELVEFTVSIYLGVKRETQIDRMTKERGDSPESVAARLEKDNIAEQAKGLHFDIVVQTDDLSKEEVLDIVSYELNKILPEWAKKGVSHAC